MANKLDISNAKPFDDGVPVDLEDRSPGELRGAGVLDYQRTEEGIRIGTDGNVSLQQAGCRFCGACIEVCPTGSIVDTLNMFDERKSYADNALRMPTILGVRAGEAATPMTSLSLWNSAFGNATMRIWLNCISQCCSSDSPMSLTERRERWLRMRSISSSFSRMAWSL